MTLVIEECAPTESDLDWLGQEVASLTDEIEILSPSEWAEQNRYLPPSVTSMPGYYDYSIMPYLREIVDCMDVRSSVREVSLKKGAQVGWTTGVLENAIGYSISVVKSAPCMFLTADAELAKLRMEAYVVPMIQQSGLAECLQSSDELSSRKSAKALHVNTPIPTPTGMRPICDIHPGDDVYSIDGSIVKVDCESPIHVRPSYAVTMSNGEVIIASDDHRWTVQTASGECVVTTQEMYDGGLKVGKRDFKYRIDIPAPVCGIETELPINPYTFGAWLGDGTSLNASITIGDYSDQMIANIKADGYYLKKWASKNRTPTYGIRIPDNVGKGTNNFHKRLSGLNVLGNKHIPDVYLLASENQRMQLLRGIMDTDGTCGKRGQCKITQKNQQLAFDIWRLVSSLGFKATIKRQISKSQNGTESYTWWVAFFASADRPVFCIDEKRDRLKPTLASRSSRITIKEIIPVGDQVVKCIGVDHPSHLFLVGRTHTPTHNTDKKVEWIGGGSLLPFGARNAAKLRSFSIKFLFEDENDGFPHEVGKDGCPQKLAEARCKGYWQVRKILRGSTPLLRGTSKIDRSFDDGDQRYYNIKCKGCGEKQRLRFSGETEDGKKFGLVYERDLDGRLIRDTVRYRCPHCGYDHNESDKRQMFANGEWIPTARSKSDEIRSYHLSSLYSPPTMFSWADCVQSYLDAWDLDNNRPKDLGLLQEFYNNVLGESFEMRSNKRKFEMLSTHRRDHYTSGFIPNDFARRFCGGPIGIVTMSGDVHKTHIDLAAIGWTPGKRACVIKQWRLEGDCEDLEAEPWRKLEEIIDTTRFGDGEGRSYPISVTLIDSGYNSDLVIQFCGKYESGVFPSIGRNEPTKVQKITEFGLFKTSLGTDGVRITVDIYKSRWDGALRREWDGVSVQPMGHFNVPLDFPDSRIKELTQESKIPVLEKETNKRIGWKWHRPSGSRNEMWDLLVYNSAALDLAAWDLMVRQLENDAVDWLDFWEAAAEPGLYFDLA